MSPLAPVLQAAAPAMLTGPDFRAGSVPVSSRWAAVLSHTDPRYGGLSSAVPRLSQSLASEGIDVSLSAFCVPSEHFRPAGFDDEHLHFWPVSRSPWITSSTLRDQFTATVQAVDGVHIHGLWEASTAMAGQAAKKLHKPYLLSAHGMLEPWALANKKWKKWIYGELVEKAVVARASCLHALTRAEAAQYRNFGAHGPIAVVPNAVDVPDVISAEPFLVCFPSLRGKRLVLFLGRLHPKKGLDLLESSWAKVSGLFPNAHLVLAGPDADGIRDELEASFRAKGLSSTVTFTGMLDGAMKWSALAAAEIFTLPSYSEGLSMGALEAMGAGLPVLVTHPCNMPEVAEYQTGWVIDAKVDQLTSALEAALRSHPEQNRELGGRGRALITSRYNSRHIAASMAEVYRYILDGIPPRNVNLL